MSALTLYCIGPARVLGKLVSPPGLGVLQAVRLAIHLQHMGAVPDLLLVRKYASILLNK